VSHACSSNEFHGSLAGHTFEVSTSPQTHWQWVGARVQIRCTDVNKQSPPPFQPPGDSLPSSPWTRAALRERTSLSIERLRNFLDVNTSTCVSGETKKDCERSGARSVGRSSNASHPLTVSGAVTHPTSHVASSIRGNGRPLSCLKFPDERCSTSVHHHHVFAVSSVSACVCFCELYFRIAANTSMRHHCNVEVQIFSSAYPTVDVEQSFVATCIV
jgi:hypothetical protein